MICKNYIRFRFQFYWNTAKHSFIYCLWLLLWYWWQNRVVVTETKWPAKPQIFTNWPLTEKQKLLYLQQLPDPSQYPMALNTQLAALSWTTGDYYHSILTCWEILTSLFPVVTP